MPVANKQTCMQSSFTKLKWAMATLLTKLEKENGWSYQTTTGVQWGCSLWTARPSWWRN